MKKNKILSAVICMFILCFSLEIQGQDLSAIRKEIEKNNKLYFDLFQKKDIAIIHLYTDDACLLPPGTAAICGTTALTNDFQDTYQAGHVKAVQFLTKDIYGNGLSYVTEEGNWQVFDTADHVMDKGRYLKLWKKTKQGWRIFRDEFNSDHKAE